MLIKNSFPLSANYTSVGLHAHSMTLLEELQARILAKACRENESSTMAANSATTMSLQTEKLNPSARNAAPGLHAPPLGLAASAADAINNR